MIKINIANIAKMKGLNNAYALQKSLKCSPTMASRLWKGKFEQIGIKTINNLCDLLDCLPSDLLVYSSGREKVKKPARKPEAVKTMASDSDLLTTIQVAERLGLSRKRINDYIVSGELKAVKGKGNQNFISEFDLQEFVANRSGQAE